MSPAGDASLVFKHFEVIASLREQDTLLQRIAEEITRAILSRDKCSGAETAGCAADSQHLAAELMGRFRRERCGLASIALTTDTSVLTAVANHYGYERVFQRQVEALCITGGVVVRISTSVSSNNVCAALESGRRRGAFTEAFTGESAEQWRVSHTSLSAFGRGTRARIQEAHILCGHVVCDWIERGVCERGSAASVSHG